LLNKLEDDDSDSDNAQAWLTSPIKNDKPIDKSKNIIIKKTIDSGFFEQDSPTEEYIDISAFGSKKKKQKKENHKRILCLNIITKKNCRYGTKCLYAHSLEEQKLNEVRHKAYQIIKGKHDLSNVNIFHDKELYRTLTLLGDVCPGCKKGNCTGGYNCKHGSFSEEHTICNIDLNNGSCSGNCGKQHLTKRGLKPYFSYIMESQKKRMANNKPNIGTLLTADFFKKLDKDSSIDTTDCLSDDDSIDSDSLGEEGFETSIFLVPLRE
jgi:hypothetical protein